MTSPQYVNKVVRGAASELLASAHLMAQGYHVFRALSAHCPVDLIAYRPGEQPLRVEVKTAVFVPTGLRRTPYFSAPANDEWDLLAVVHYNGDVTLLTNSGDFEDVKDAYYAAVGAVRPSSGSATHCKWGHEYTPENIQWTIKGHRNCRECARDRYRAKRALQKAGAEGVADREVA